MEVDYEEQRLINGALMKKYTGQFVRIWINIAENTSTGGHKVHGTSADNRTINVVLAQPLNQPLSGWIEVIGTPVEDGVRINCSEILVFQNDENSEPLDQEAHNNIVLVMENMMNFSESGDGAVF